MIIVQTPLRISFLGGGSDFEDFYSVHGGAVFSTAIDKYVYVILKERFDNAIYVNYSRKERVQSVDDIEHDLVREAMKLTGVSNGIEITTLADIPSEGTGLGSSSSITVALLQAFHIYQNAYVTAETLAKEACHIEIDVVGKPIGKQDQYIAAYGDMRFITFNRHSIEINEVRLSSESKRALNENLLLFFTGIDRDSSSILMRQKANINQRLDILSELKSLAYMAKDAVFRNDFEYFGKLLYQGWELKKQLASGISSSEVDELYEVARRAGAIGGKITGAGGGGFLLLYCNKERQDEVRKSLIKLRELPFAFEKNGSKVIFDYRRAL